MAIQTEAELLMQLRKDYEARGFTLESGHAFDTGGESQAHPDLVARKDGKTVLIVIRPYGGSERDEERIRALSKLVADREGWSFRLFFVEGPETALPEPPGQAKIAVMLERARALKAHGDSALALLAAWSALEAAARRALARHGQRPKLFAGSSLVKELISYGYLGQDHLTRFHDLARKRDLAAHGFFHPPPPEEDAGAVIALAEDLSGENARELNIAAASDRPGMGETSRGRRTRERRSRPRK